MNKIELVTPCVRPENLERIASSLQQLPPGAFRWWVVLDGVELPASCQLPPEAIVLQHTDKRSMSGNAQRNHALDQMGCHANSWVHFLDDDTLMHPDWWAAIGSGALADLVLFPSELPDGQIYTLPDVLRTGQIDSSNLLIHRPLIGDLRWRLESYDADGQFIEACAARSRSRRIIRRPLGLYNALSPTTPEPSNPQAWIDVLQSHTGPKALIIEPGTDPAQLLLDQISAALLADATGAAVHFHDTPAWYPPIDSRAQALQQRNAMGFRCHCHTPAPPAANPMHVTVWRRPELFARVARWSAANPDVSINISSPHFREVLPFFSYTEALSALRAELRSGWQLFDLNPQPDRLPAIVVDLTGGPATTAQRQAISIARDRFPEAQFIEVSSPLTDYWSSWWAMAQATALVMGSSPMGLTAGLLSQGEVWACEPELLVAEGWQTIPEEGE